MDIQRPHYLNKLIEKQDNGMIKVITGIRRCGKSILLFNLFYDYLLDQGVDKEHIIPIALDDDTFADYRDPQKLSQYIRSKITSDGKYFIFIDEVQYAISKEELNNPEEIRLYNVLNGLLRLRNVDIYVTGSNSKLLTKDVLSAFRGRGDEVKVYPLTFKEYYSYVGGDKYEAYQTYITYGGMPLAIKQKSDKEKANYLSGLFRETYFKDILERYSIEYPDVLENLTDDLCSSIGSLTNSKKISDTLQSIRQMKVSSTTISTYLGYLTDSFLFSVAKRYDIKGKKYFEYPSKYYCADIGLRNAKLNYRQQEETHMMENLIYNELLARDYLVDVGVVVIYERVNGVQKQKQTEIDFIATDGSTRYYIQSALSLDDPSKIAAELRPLKNTKDHFKKIVISKSSLKPWTDEDGILHIGIIDFLLDENSLKL